MDPRLGSSEDRQLTKNAAPHPPVDCTPLALNQHWLPTTTTVPHLFLHRVVVRSFPWTCWESRGRRPASRLRPVDETDRMGLRMRDQPRAVRLLHRRIANCWEIWLFFEQQLPAPQQRN